MQPDGSTIHTTTDYSYDALDRLTEETVATDDPASPASTTDYTLHLVGNRMKEIQTQSGHSTETDSSYNDRDELTQQTVLRDGVQASQTTFGYDDNGSLTNQSSDNGDSTAYWYGARGRLSGATLIQGGITTETVYEYTAEGVRASEVVNGTSTRYVIDAFGPSGYSQVVEEWSDGSTGAPILLASFVFGSRLTPISQTKVTHDSNDQVTGTQTGLFLTDGHSGVRQVIDAATGAVILANRYDAFGTTISTAGTFATPIGYQGQWFDPVLGQYVMRARLYDPTSGRFTAMDPFSGNYTDPLQLMRYGYAGGNPVANSDPNGTDFLASVMIAVGNFAGRMAQVAGAVAPVLAKVSILALKFGLASAAIGMISHALGFHDFGNRAFEVAGFAFAVAFGAALLWSLAVAVEAIASATAFAAYSYNLNLINCFPPETVVGTETGLRPINQIHAGERVWSYDFLNGVWRLCRVTCRHDANYSGILVTILVDGGHVTATAFHPFWVMEGDNLMCRPTPRHLSAEEDRNGALPGRWVNSHDLQEGDVILLKDCGPVTVRQVLQRQEMTSVCNLTIEELHTFAVGEMQVLVHNTSGSLPAPIRTTSAGPVFKNFNDAQANAMSWLRDRGFDPTKAQPNISKFTGEVNGLKMDGNIGFRIEFDARNGAHINVFAGKEKGPHFMVDKVDEAGLIAILRQLFGG